MKFRFDHNNINVLDLDRSLAFYKEALGLEEVRRYEAPDGSFILVYLGDGTTNHLLELTWLKDRKEAYDLGENEFHIALRVDDYEAAHAHHEKMGCICFENPEMGIYFINDPDDYWIEILPNK
ncbi:MAG: lactoylglutathione lyase [Clostridiales bacterium]|uniref:VOC family protein n=1 Tax=Clostridium sp. N3C TaxID=1776758 RepID=UPI00092E0A44|nr:VOC family protein [Clostridium sp. N3C]NLZ47989.1 lactoylglutathione lyase [Clostridiales bacterium]SCN24421.1 Lactoylglutathione lyase [Clostridium sp. N3C]